MFAIRDNNKHYSEAVKNAIFKRDNTSVMTLLRNHQSVDISDYTGTTLLHLACVYDNFTLTAELIRTGCNVNAQHDTGLTPLALAVLYGRVVTVELLLEAGADFYLADHSVGSALQAVAVISQLSDIGWRPPQVGVFDDIRSRSARVTIVSAVSMVPLFVDAMRRRNISSKDIALLLLEAGWPLYLGILAGDVEVTRTMLESGRCLVNESSRMDGLTALHRAVNMDDIGQVALLLEHGADVNAKDVHGQVPLCSCWQIEMNLEMLKLLLTAGTRLEQCSETGRMQSYSICEYGNREAVQVLLEHTADLTAKDVYGETILHYVALNSNEDVFDLFHEVDLLDVNVRNASGHSPLHLAAKYTNIVFVKLLLEKGANANLQDNVGCTPLDFTAMRRYSSTKRRETTILLLKYGASLTRNCLEQAMQHENYKTIVQPALEHLARLEIQMDAGIKTVMSSDEEGCRAFFANHAVARMYYEACKEQLKVMKDLKVFNTVSFFDLMTASVDRIARYARNPELIQAFKSVDLVAMFPIYAAVLSKQFSEGVEKQKLMQTTATFFSDCVNIVRSDHAVIEKIVSYLTIEDMKELTKDFKDVSLEGR